jgi:tRNA pseudouridine55 synthase
LDGILNIDKPSGMTSHAVVARLRHLSGQRRVGHAGTLDPDATGVLPVCLGKATRVIEFFSDAVKIYRACIELGTATDTYDASGKVTSLCNASGIDRQMVETALEDFRGSIEQTPPMFSALKHRGQPLYRLARAGITVARPSRTVTIHRLELLSCEFPEVTLEIECSKGTYIRSLAHDLGVSLKCGAHLKNLVRTRNGMFDITGASGLSVVEEAFAAGNAAGLLYPVDSVLQDMERLDLDGPAALAVSMGKALPDILPPGASADEYRRAYWPDGRFLAVLYYDREESAWRPKKVFTQGVTDTLP